MEAETWRPVIKMCVQMLNRTSQLKLTIMRDQILWKVIAKIVDWDITLIQLARLPKAKRWNPMVTHTHRLCVLLGTNGDGQGNTGTIHVIAERLSDSVGLRERFEAPMKLDLFIFGTTHEQINEDLGPTPQPSPRQQPSTYGDQIWFEGGPEDVDVKRTVARMHNNLGHPEAATLTRMAIAANASSQALAAIRALR
eukprot:12411074-Karenia_brevis.AAC.1